MKYYTCTELAKMYGYNRVSVHNLIKNGRIKAIKDCNTYYIAESELDNLPMSWRRRRDEHLN